LSPPTFFETNEFTWVVQEIVNTYGIPSFGEANPAVLTSISFPFLFGVMFGDIGHGGLLFIVAGALVYFADKLRHIEELEFLLSMRYLLLLMGFFATYMGLIYNDFMSIPLELFGPGCYSYDKARDKNAYTKPDAKAQDCMYPFGFDPVWMNSESDITFYNSFKMKASVIMAIIHMSIGIILKGLNALHFNRKLDFYHEFIPQLILLLCLFGFMDVLIIQKWLTDWERVGDTSKAPSIINAMIGMFLKGGESDPTREFEIIGNQTFMMRFMVFLAMVTPPWMLCVKPLLLKR